MHPQIQTPLHLIHLPHGSKKWLWMAACAVALSAAWVDAQTTYTWNGADAPSNDTWSDSANWAGDSTPTPSSINGLDLQAIVLNPDSTSITSSDMDGTYYAASLTLNTSSDLDLTSSTGGTLFLYTGGLTQDSTAGTTTTIDAAVALYSNISNQTWNIESGNLVQSGDLSLGGNTLTVNTTSSTSATFNNISGPGGMKFTGSGTTYINGAASYSTSIDVAGGTLSITGSLTGGGGMYPPTFTVDGASGTTATLAAGASLSAEEENIGESTTGTFHQTGGTNSITQLYLGYNQGSSGTYNLDGGSITANAELVGYNGTGTFNQSAGTNSSSNLLELGCSATNSGSYNLSGGSLSASSAEFIGYSGTGTFTQSGGTNTTMYLFLSYNSGSSGTYNLSAGELSPYSEYIGYSSGGTNTFNQCGGTNAVSYYNFYIGYNSGSSGTYNLSGGTFSSGSAGYIGYYGTGTFNQTAGTSTLSSISLYLGDYSGSQGAYNLSGGKLSGDIGYIGNSGTGTFTQTGGTSSFSGNLYLGENAGSTGNYNLSGDSSVTLSTSGTYVGYYGTGTFTQTGGINTIAVNLVLGHQSGSSGTYILSGGTLKDDPTSSQYAEYVGYNGGTGLFTQSGGANSTPSLLIGSYTTTSQGTYNLNGGTLTAGSVNDGNLNGFTAFGTSTFNLNDGTLITGSITAGGGTFTFNFDGGTLQANQSTNTFMSALTTANVQVGGAIIDTHYTNIGYAITIGQALLHDTTPGAPAIDGGLTKNGIGTLTLTGNNTYTGGTTIDAGTLSISADNNLGNASGGVKISSGGTLQVTSSINTSRSFTINSGGTLSASGNTIGLTGSIKNDGTMTGTLNIGSGGVAGGTGTFGAVDLESGGTFHPGDSPGTAITDDATWNGGGTYQFDIDDAGGDDSAAGTNWSLWQIDGTLTLDASTINQITIAVNTLGDSDTPGDMANFNPSLNYSWLIADAAGGFNGSFDAADFDINTAGVTNKSADGQFSISDPDGRIYLNYTSATVVPLPAAVYGGLGLLGMVTVVRRIRRRGD